MAKKRKKGDPAWYRTWKIIVGVIGGLVVICSATFTTWTYAKSKLTQDVSERLDIIEGQVDMLIVSVDGLKVLVVDKKYEIDKDLVIMVIEAHEERQKLALKP